MNQENIFSLYKELFIIFLNFRKTLSTHVLFIISITIIYYLVKKSKRPRFKSKK
jgi:cbb3-type cytochrome oxidase subunit 3